MTRRVPGTLTERERQVMARVSFGWSMTEIADDLGCAPSTVQKHIENAMRALRARTRAHAVGILLRTGMVGYAIEDRLPVAPLRLNGAPDMAQVAS